MRAEVRRDREKPTFMSQGTAKYNKARKKVKNNLRPAGNPAGTCLKVLKQWAYAETHAGTPPSAVQRAKLARMATI